MKPRRTLFCLIALLLGMPPLSAQAVPFTYDWGTFDAGGSTAYGVYDVTNTTVLAQNDFVQLIWAGMDGVPDYANCDPHGTPGGDDVQVDAFFIQNGGTLPPPAQNKGYIPIQNYVWDSDAYAGKPKVVYIRAWNAVDGAISTTSFYGDSIPSLLTDAEFNAPRWNTNTQCGPNAIEFAGLDAKAVGPAVEVSWRTASEFDVAGFNVWRSSSLDGTYARVNDSPILATGGPARGTDYVYTDAALPPGDAHLYYKVEAVSTGGSSTFRGPVSVDLGSNFKLFLPVLMR